ncbi:MAG: hypothetical protein U9Q76_07920, partial [candidate division WOR-3 bacterium]|nr:hypothetical protein [candidate division WOR-3 bacterium]
LTPLGKLAFASSDYPWDAQAAAKRVQDALGWSALALYSLRVDTSADSESFEAYPMLVVDIVDGEPRVVPAALKAASEALTDLDEETRSAVEDRLKILDERLARVSQIKEESRSEAEGPLSEGEEDKASGSEVQSEAQDERGPQPSAKQSVGVKVDRGPRSDTKYSSGVKAERLDAAERIVERLAHQGRLLPAWGREALVGFISGLSDEKSLSDEGFEPISPLDFFTGLLESLPALVPLSEFASPQARVDNSFESLGRRIAASIKHSAVQHEI